MKDETYVKEILQKFGEAVDCYAAELRDRKVTRILRDAGISIHECSKSEEVARMSAGCNSDYPVDHMHLRKMPSSLSEPPTLLNGAIIYGLDRDSHYVSDSEGVTSEPRLGKTTRGTSGI